MSYNTYIWFLEVTIDIENSICLNEIYLKSIRNEYILFYVVKPYSMVLEGRDLFQGDVSAIVTGLLRSTGQQFRSTTTTTCYRAY